MPNQLNFPDPIPVPYIAERPSRLSSTDRNLVEQGNKQVQFGTSAKDVVELWAYDSNGSIAGHLSLDPTSDLISLTTVVDNTGTYEMLNIDMGKVSRVLALETGRYGFVANFFRTEAGSENGDKFYIVDISDDRTELRLYPSTVSDKFSREIFEWVVPSVPKIEAQGLLAQTFGKTTDIENSLTVETVTTAMNESFTDLTTRVSSAGGSVAMGQLISQMFNDVYLKALDFMAADVNNINIQEDDLEQYLQRAITDVMVSYKAQGKIDPKFEVF